MSHNSIFFSSTHIIYRFRDFVWLGWSRSRFCWMRIMVFVFLVSTGKKAFIWVYSSYSMFFFSEIPYILGAQRLVSSDYFYEGLFGFHWLIRFLRCHRLGVSKMRISLQIRVFLVPQNGIFEDDRLNFLSVMNYGLKWPKLSFQVPKISCSIVPWIRCFFQVWCIWVISGAQD